MTGRRFLWACLVLDRDLSFNPSSNGVLVRIRVSLRTKMTSITNRIGRR
jgi:hypothetical protein